MSLENWVRLLRQAPEFQALADALASGQRSVWVDGLTAPARALLLAFLQATTPACALLNLVPSADHAERRCEDLLSFGVGQPRLYPTLLLPQSEKGPLPSAADADLGALRERLQALEDLMDGAAGVVVAPITAALQPVPDPVSLRHSSVALRAGAHVSLQEVAQRLTQIGYERVTTVRAPGEFAIRGGILDLFPLNEEQAVRADFFGDEIESIRRLDVESQRSFQPLDRVTVLPTAPAGEACEATLLDYLSEHTLVVVEEPRQLEARWEEYCTEHHGAQPEMVNRWTHRQLEAAIHRLHQHPVLYLTLGARTAAWSSETSAFPITSHPCGSFTGPSAALAAIEEWYSAGWQVVIASERTERLVELLTEHRISVTSEGSGDEGNRPGETETIGHGHSLNEKPFPSSRLPKPVICYPGTLSAGFLLPGLRLAVLTDAEVFGTRKIRRPRRLPPKGQRITALAQLKEGDFVVHLQYGIGRFHGIVSQSVEGAQRDYLLLEYAENTKLYVPVEHLDRVSRYIGSDDHPPQLHHIGSREWQHTQQRVRARVREMAADLLALYAKRASTRGFAFSPDTPWQREMEESFIYEETPDQLRAIRDVKADMESPRPMDRLVCGDVGYGKTEVAVRAAFKAVMDGKQVAVLVPTTVLAQQHYNTFSERLAAFPVRIEMLSRFRSQRDQARIVRDLAQGTVDIVIGTHRLLSKDVAFRDLGLVIVDEEQRFGVGHKERLKQLRTSVDVLTLTATPIPRTLHMALSGIRDLSMIHDPPEGRTPIRTLCIERDEAAIREAILRELDRDGQVYFVHNRVETIEAVAERLRQLVPQARIAVAHGQMPEERLEQVMLDFYDCQYDVLVCTTIIESGLDIPNVNTILIDHAPHLGLGQLYQLRGRVGRSPRQAYCYLLYDPRRVLTETAQKRLEAIREFTALGSGFQIALRDLEIRGAGNLLGAEQHGFMLSVGFDLYCRLIAEAVRELKGEEVSESLLPTVDLPVDAHLPSDYVPDDEQRLILYQRMATVRTLADVQAVEEELRDRFGPLPRPVHNLLEILRLRVAAAEAGVAKIEAKAGHISVRLDGSNHFTEKEIARLWRLPVVQRPGWRWTQIRHDRIGIELHGASALAASLAAVQAVAQRTAATAPAQTRSGVAL